MGATCSSGFNGPVCAAGLFCGYDGTKSVCQPRSGAGAACNDNEQCVSGACFTPYGCLASAQCLLP